MLPTISSLIQPGKSIRLLFILILGLTVQACGGGGSTTGSDQVGNEDNQGTDDNDNTGDPNDNNGGAFPTTGNNAHNPGSVPQPVPLATNLIANGGFESDNEPWDLCGSGTIINAPGDAGTGQRYLRLDRSVLCDRFDGTVLEQSNGWAYRPIDLTEVPDALHVSMLVRSSSPIPIFEDAFEVRLMATNTRDDFFSRREATFLNSVDTAIDSSWTRVKLSISRSDIEEKIGDLVPRWLIVEAISPGPLDVIGVDDIRLTTRPEVVQPSAMPAQLIDQADRNQLVMMDISANRLVSMRGDGSSLSRYNSINTENLVIYPVFAGQNTIQLADRRFDPLVTSDPAVISGAGTNILRAIFPQATQTLISEQPGTPGYFLFSGYAGNRDAIDITVKSMAWDAVNNRGVNAVCASNRTFGFVSDDVCFLQVMNADGNYTLTDIEGSSVAISPDGTRLAFVETAGQKIYLGTLDGQTINAEVAYESRARLTNHLSFSPDGQKLLIASQSAASILQPDGTTRFPSVLKELNLADSTVESLLLTDQGELYGNFVYSHDASFVFYSIALGEAGGSQVWWLDPATGQTGPLVTEFNAVGVTRQPN